MKNEYIYKDFTPAKEQRLLSELYDGVRRLYRTEADPPSQKVAYDHLRDVMEQLNDFYQGLDWEPEDDD